MTELERVEIEGFKGLESVAFEPSGFNLITGRNNTGKTSLLEAIDLLFNPKNIEKLGQHSDSVINVDFKEAGIRGGTENEEFELLLQHPPDERAERFFLDAVLKIVKSQFSFQSTFSGSGTNYPEEFDSLTKSVSKRVFGEMIDKEMLSEIKDDILVLNVCQEHYPYFSAGRESAEIISNIRDVVAEELVEEMGHDEKGMYYSFGETKVYSTTPEASFLFSGFLEGLELFLRTPENQEVVNFINSMMISGEIKKVHEERTTLLIDDIGDYIKDKQLVDDLKTFDLDYLVFEPEDGEKYSIPYDFMGDGFKTIVGLLWELLDDETENEIVLLEEPENHMHPGYIREVVYFLIDLAQNEDVQLFVTTHNSDFIDSFFTENLTDEEEAYLREEFSLVRMEEDATVVEDYETARENLKDLHLDLRGI